MQVHAYVAILRMPTELRLVQAYYGYGRPRQQLRAHYDYGYGRTTTMATGVLRLRLRANVRAYYVNFFTAYTVYHAESHFHERCSEFQKCQRSLHVSYDRSLRSSCQQLLMHVYMHNSIKDYHKDNNA